MALSDIGLVLLGSACVSVGLEGGVQQQLLHVKQEDWELDTIEKRKEQQAGGPCDFQV